MKLTNDHRNTILAKVIKETFAEREQALKLRRIEIGELLYRMLYKEVISFGLSERMTRELFLEYGPPGFFRRVDRLKIYIAAERRDVYFPLAYERPVALRQSYYEVKAEELDPADFQEIMGCYEKLRPDIERLGKDKELLGDKLTIFLKGFNTFGQLFSGWPEAAKYIEVPEKQKNLPTVMVDEVRESIAKART